MPARPLRAYSIFFSFCVRHLKVWRERTPSNCPSRGEEIVLCNYRRRMKDKFVKRMGTIAQLVAATPARFQGRLADSFSWSYVSSYALPSRLQKVGMLCM